MENASLVCLIAVCGTHSLPLGMLNGKPWLLKAFQHCKRATMDLYSFALDIGFRNSNKLQEDVFKRRSFLHRVVSDSSIEGLAVQIRHHKYVWTSVWMQSDSWGPEPPFPMKYNWSHCCLCMLSWDNIPAIWPLTFAPFNYLSVFRTGLKTAALFVF